MFSIVVASVQSWLRWATQTSFAATALSQSALNSAQVLGISVSPSCFIALEEAQVQLMRWMFIGTATQVPVGFITGSNSGATTLSQPSLVARSVRSAVWPVSFHSLISGPLSCTAGGGLPAMASALSLARVLAVWPAIEVDCHSPPAALNMSPSLAMAAASEPESHWLSRLVLGAACAAPINKATVSRPIPAATTDFIYLSPIGAADCLSPLGALALFDRRCFVLQTPLA